MIITIKGADFSSANIGTLSTYIISKSIGSGASFDIPNFVNKNSSATWTITLDEGYTFGTYSVTMGGENITPSVVDNVMTISIAEVTGNVRIVVATVNENTGEEEGGNKPVVPPVEPDEPEDPETPSQPTKEQITFNVTDNVWFKMEDGSDVSLNQWKSTNFIEIPEGVKAVTTDDINAYRDGTNNTGCIGFWDENQNFISAAPETLVPIGSKSADTHRWRNILTLEIPENAKYMKACWEAVSGAYVHASTGNSNLLSQPVLYWIY